MASKIITTTFDQEEFEEILLKCVLQAVKSELKPQSDTQNTLNNILTRKEAANLLNISLPTLHYYTKSGLIKVHRLGTKVIYKIEDIQDALKEINYGRRK